MRTKINFGDFSLSVNVSPHEYFERDGNHVYKCYSSVHSMAVLGGTIKVPTIDDEVKIKIQRNIIRNND